MAEVDETSAVQITDNRRGKPWRCSANLVYFRKNTERHVIIAVFPTAHPVVERGNIARLVLSSSAGFGMADSRSRDRVEFLCQGEWKSLRYS
jgi:hypothetical protein